MAPALGVLSRDGGHDPRPGGVLEPGGHEERKPVGGPGKDGDGRPDEDAQGGGGDPGVDGDSLSPAPFSPGARNLSQRAEDFLALEGEAGLPPVAVGEPDGLGRRPDFVGEA